MQHRHFVLDDGRRLDEADGLVSPWDVVGGLCVDMHGGQNARGSRPAALSLQQFLPFFTPFLYPSVLHLHYHLFVCLFFYIVRPTHFYLFDFEDSRSGSRDSLCWSPIKRSGSCSGGCENRGTAGTILPTNRWSRWSGKKLDPSTPAPTPLHPSCRESEPSQRRLVVHCLVGKQASSITWLKIPKKKRVHLITWLTAALC